jgi:hypothetical protein
MGLRVSQSLIAAGGNVSPNLQSQILQAIAAFKGKAHTLTDQMKSRFSPHRSDWNVFTFGGDSLSWRVCAFVEVNLVCNCHDQVVFPCTAPENPCSAHKIPCSIQKIPCSIE